MPESKVESELKSRSFTRKITLSVILFLAHALASRMIVISSPRTSPFHSTNTERSFHASPVRTLNAMRAPHLSELRILIAVEIQTRKFCERCRHISLECLSFLFAVNILNKSLSRRRTSLPLEALDSDKKRNIAKK